MELLKAVHSAAYSVGHLDCPKAASMVEHWADCLGNSKAGLTDHLTAANLALTMAALMDFYLASLSVDCSALSQEHHLAASLVGN